MKKLPLLFVLLACSLLRAQTTTVSATVTDSDGQVWANGTWQLNFNANPSQPNVGIYNINGVPLNQAFLVQKGTLDASGSFTQTGVYDNNQVLPGGSSWSITICPNASVLCTTIANVPISGPTMSLSSLINSQIKPPRFPAQQTGGAAAHGYADVEINPLPTPGGSYFNVTSNQLRIWTGTTWVTSAGGGGGNPSIPGTIQGANPSATGFISTNEIIGTAVAGYSTPESAVAAACASPSSNAVYFPAGIYTVTTGMLACSSLHIRCAGPSQTATSGTIFRAQAGFAGWMLSNPNADSTTPGSGNTGVRVEGCTFDMSLDPQALGTIRHKGISSSAYAYNSFYSNNNPNPVITWDGGNFSNNGGDYDTDWIGNKLYDTSSSSTAIGILVTNCGVSNNSTTPACIPTQTFANSNEDHWFGGYAVRFGFPILIDAGDNNSFYSMDIEDATQKGIWLTTQANRGIANGGIAAGNSFFKPRLEFGCTSCNGILQDLGAIANTFYNPIFGGAYDYYEDNNAIAANTCEMCLLGNFNTGTSHYGSVYATGTTGGGLRLNNFSFNALQTSLDGYQFGVLAMHGNLQTDRQLLIQSSATGGGSNYNALQSVAQSPVISQLPLSSGMLLSTNQTLPITALCNSTLGSNCSSNQMQFLGNYTTTSLGFVAYVSGITAVGTIGQTCLLSNFNNGLSGATATVALTATNFIATNTTATITNASSGGTAPPTIASVATGTATSCTGTATVGTALQSLGDTYQIHSAVQTGTAPNTLLIFNHSGSPGTATYEFIGGGQLYVNSLQATAILNQAPPPSTFFGACWNGSASQNLQWVFNPDVNGNFTISQTSGCGSGILKLPAGTTVGGSPIATGGTPVRAGTVTVSSGTTAAATFGTAFSSGTPFCNITPTGNPTTAGVYWITSISTSGFTANIAGTAPITFNYVCSENNTN